MYVVYYQELLIWSYVSIIAYYYLFICMSVRVLFGEGIRCPPPSESPYLFEAGSLLNLRLVSSWLGWDHPRDLPVSTHSKLGMEILA